MKPSRTIYALVFLSTVVTTPCTGADVTGSPSKAPVEHETEKSSLTSTLTVTPDYILGPEDVLEINVWKNADLSKQVQVRPDGRISLPLIGDVPAVGRTTTQLTGELTTRLASYMENPTVSILVKEVNSYAIYVLGEVAKPGKYPLKTKTTLLQALTLYVSVSHAAHALALAGVGHQTS